MGIEKDHIDLDFLSEKKAPLLKPSNRSKYKILINDDSEEVHKVTELILRNFQF